jgi:hypothetical protein
VIDLILTIVFCYFNPALFLYYVLSSSYFSEIGIETMESVGTNSQRIKLKVYFVLIPILFVIWNLLVYLVLGSVNPDITLWDIMSIQRSYLVYFSCACTAITLSVYLGKPGMEGNVMGFIFAPFMLLALVLMAYKHFMWLSHHIF